MKTINLFLFLLINFISLSQNKSEEITFFAQCKFEINDQKELKILEERIRQNPNVKVVRLDFVSQRSFILTKNISELTEVQFSSWFENYIDSISCIQIGVYGIDKINPYPFTNCNNK